MLVTLLTSHKGVDLHAATARQVMSARLAGGEHLVNLWRCEIHMFVAGSLAGGVETLLATGRFYNPNKHHFGVFELPELATLLTASDDHTLPPGWPGEMVASSEEKTPDLYQRFLGGPAPQGQTGVDIATFVRGQSGPVISGVLWRLVLSAGHEEAGVIASRLAVARGRKEGLLLNPHLEDWLLAVRE